MPQYGAPAPPAPDGTPPAAAETGAADIGDPADDAAGADEVAGEDVIGFRICPTNEPGLAALLDPAAPEVGEDVAGGEAGSDGIAGCFGVADEAASLTGT